MITNDLNELLEWVEWIELAVNKDPILAVGITLILLLFVVVIIPCITTSYKTDTIHRGKYLHGRMIK